jgi:hypothetical protein
MAKLNKNLKTLARQAGGSFKTVADRMKIADRFADRLQSLNIQIRDIKNIKTGHVELYIRSRLSENISKRTLQNEMSAIRSLLRVAGKTFMADPSHEKLSNEALSISGTSRDGTKVAITDEHLDSVLSLVKEKMKVWLLPFSYLVSSVYEQRKLSSRLNHFRHGKRLCRMERIKSE